MLLNFRFIQAKYMHDAEVDSANLSRVVVKQRDDLIFEIRLDLDFLAHLALDSGAIGFLIRAKSDSSSSFICPPMPMEPFATSRCSPAFFPRT